MTREEARNELVLWRNRNSDNGYHYKFIEALTMAIKAIEQEPCEDCVSREEVKKIVDFYKTMYDGICRVNEDIDKLPSVTPQEPKQESILDKIRSEIEQERVGYPPSADYYKAIMKCLQIIDKYKESEGKE